MTPAAGTPAAGGTSAEGRIQGTDANSAGGEGGLSAAALRMQEMLSRLPGPDGGGEAGPGILPMADLARRLLGAGFPARHVRQLGAGLHGPSLAKARELWPRLAGGDALFLLTGDRGPGKTQMAAWWAGERVRAGQSAGRYVKCADLLGEIKATWHEGGRRVGTEHDVLRKYRRAPYLVIDEFHERGGSDWENRCLVNLLDHRYDDMLATVLIANFAESKVAEAIPASVISRAQQTGGLVVCDWRGYR